MNDEIVDYEGIMGDATIEVRYKVNGKDAVLTAEVEGLRFQHIKETEEFYFHRPELFKPYPIRYNLTWKPTDTPHYTVRIKEVNDAELAALKDGAVRARAELKRAKESLEEQESAVEQYRKRVVRLEEKYEALKKYDDGSRTSDEW